MNSSISTIITRKFAFHDKTACENLMLRNGEKHKYNAC